MAFGAYTRDIMERAGPLDEELVRNQDDEYNYRLRQMGARIMLIPGICSRYYSRASLRSLWRQYFQYGLWKVRVAQKHPRQMCPRQFVPALFVWMLLGSLMLALFSSNGRVLFFLTAGAYLGVSLLASVLSVRGRKWRLLPLLPIAFATLHLSYGLGFWVGLIKFWNRWGDKENVYEKAQPGSQGEVQR